MSYIGLFSYYNFDNWAYQPSYVSSNTPWFFNGLRVQVFPTDKVKVKFCIFTGGKAMADLTSGRAWADKSSGAQPVGSIWCSTITEWARIRWAFPGVPGCTPMAASS